MNLEEVLADAIVTPHCVAPHTMVAPPLLTDSELCSLAPPVLYIVGQHEKICSPIQALNRLRSVAPEIAAHPNTGRRT